VRITPPSTNLISAHFGQTVATLRENITRTAEESTTGRYSDLTAHLSGRIGTAMMSQKAVDDIAFRREQLSLREGRLDVTQQSLSLIHDRVLGLDTRMREALANGNELSQGLTARDAKAALGNVFNMLNVRFGERFLFAGDATATQPLASPDDLLADLRNLADTAIDAADFAASLDTYFNTPGGGWQTSMLQSSPNASDPDAVTANDPALVELISGLAMLALSDPDTSPALLKTDPDIVLAGAERVTSGLTALTNVRADRGVIQEQIEVEKESLNVEETIFTIALNNLSARDQYEAATALKQLESTLEASYLLTSRLSSLSLLNYLR
jgi:flagellar hook-associated protein 3 FlgL